MQEFTTDTHLRAFAADSTCSWAARQLICVKLLLYGDLWGKTRATRELTLVFSCYSAHKLGIFPRASALQIRFRLQRAFSVSDLKRAQVAPAFPCPCLTTPQPLQGKGHPSSVVGIIFQFLDIWLENILAFSHLKILVEFFSLVWGYSESLWFLLYAFFSCFRRWNYFSIGWALTGWFI